MTVSMALWKAIHDRYELLKVTFDSGASAPMQAEQLSTLIWGRLDVLPAPGATPSGRASRPRPMGRSPSRCPRRVGCPTP